METALIPSPITPESITQEPLKPHMEVMDTSSGDIWLHQPPTTLAAYDALKPEAPYIKSGIACAAMDFAYFLKSPGADVEGPLETRTIGGLEWSRVARPLDFHGFNSGPTPTLIQVDKHHVIGFTAGSTLRLARLPDGKFYIQQTRSAWHGKDVYPTDWALFTLVLEQPWSIYLDSPSPIYFFRNLRSFAGAFDADVFPGDPQPAPRSTAS